jgi:uncharacterized protein
MPATDLFIPTARHALAALSAWLDKAAAHAAERGESADALMTLRLAPDMYPLASQVRFVAFQAQEALHRLAGTTVPEPLLDLRRAGWGANEAPGSFTEAKAAVESAVAILAEADPASLQAGADRALAIELPNGIVFDITGDAFVRDWALPQLYFHLVAAYALLRQHGVPLGKADFVPHMFAYVRPGTMPTA